MITRIILHFIYLIHVENVPICRFLAILGENVKIDNFQFLPDLASMHPILRYL